MSLLSTVKDPAVKRLLIFLVIAYGLFLLLLPDSGYDKYFWITWTRAIMDHGLGSAYQNSEINNHPLVLYLLRTLAVFFPSASAITAISINWLKALVVLFDMSAIVVLAVLLRRLGLALGVLAIVALNPALWYNTIVWGQVDACHTFLIFLSLVSAERGRARFAWVLFLLALNFKLQAIIFFPLLTIITWPRVRDSSWGERIKAVWVLIGIQTIIFLPFILTGNLKITMDALLTRSVDHFAVISRYAYNVWYFFFTDPAHASDSLRIMRLSIKLWGIILFFLASAMSMSLVALAVYNRAFENLNRWQRTLAIFQVAALVGIAFFLFATQMHERYIHPVILLSSVPFLLNRNFVVFGLVSIGYLLNLEAVMQMGAWYDQLLGITIQYDEWLIFNPKLIASLFLSAFIFGVFVHAKLFLSFRNENQPEIVTT